MSSQTLHKKRTGDFVMRATSSIAVFWIGVAVMAVVIAASLFQGNLRLFAFVIAPALLLTWILWILLYRPAVRYDTNRVVVVNVARTHVLPWHRVASVRQRLGIDFELAGGGVVRAIAVPPPREPGIVARNFDRRTRPAFDFSRNAEILDGFRSAAAPGDESVVSRWELLPLAIGIVPIIAVLLEVLFKI